MAAEKPFKPSARKLERARKEGQVLKAPILTSSIGLLAGILMTYWISRSSWVRNSLLIEYWFRDDFTYLYSKGLEAGLIVLVIVVLPLVSAGAVTMTAGALISGWVFTPSVLSPRASRLCPAKGLKRMLGGAKEVWQHLLRLVVLGFFLLYSVIEACKVLPVLVFSEVSLKYQFFGKLVFSTLFGGVLVLVAFGGIEFIFKKRAFWRELSMSKEELKREYKDQEGDPNLKAHRKSLHDAILRTDLISQIRKAKVVIVEKL